MGARQFPAARPIILNSQMVIVRGWVWELIKEDRNF
jgi:hypothetical protein